MDTKPPMLDHELSADCMIDEIEDFMTEHPNTPSTPNELIEKNRNHIVLLRTFYRSKFGKEAPKYKAVMTAISSYLLHAQDITSGRQSVVASRQIVAHQDSFNFDLKGTKEKLKELKFKIQPSVLEAEDTDLEKIQDHVTQSSNEELEEMKRNISLLSKDLERLSARISTLISKCPTGKVDEIKTLEEGYETLFKHFISYGKFIDIEIKGRDLNKVKTFNKSQLSITLPRFSGYLSSINYYKFKSDFDKLYLNTVPKQMMPDFLKNNFLEGTALSLVKHESDIDEIWTILKNSFGDVKRLLTNKHSELNHLDKLSKIKEPTKVVEAIGKIVNLMKELMSLADEHQIEPHLYYGDGINQIYNAMGNQITMKWLTSCAEDDETPDGKQLWTKLLTFLERETKIYQQKELINFATGQHNPPDNSPKGKVGRSNFFNQFKSNACQICGATDHFSTTGPSNSKLTQYFVCEKFSEMSPRQRFKYLSSRNLCFQCLFPGALINTGRHRDGRCQHDFVCPHESHDPYPIKKHVLVCEEHKTNPQNEQLLKDFKARYMRNPNLPDCAKNIQLVHHVNIQPGDYHANANESSEIAIYMLQQISINNQTYLVFYDTGCSDFVIRTEAAKRLKDNATLESSRSINIGGVGGVSARTRGDYAVRIPTVDGPPATFFGPALDRITHKFPTYPLQEAYNDLKASFLEDGRSIDNLPTLPTSIGGEVDLMIGIKFLRYHPEPIFKMPSGLTIYKSAFKNPDGSRGVIGGPHQIFSSIHKQGIHFTFFSNQLRSYQAGYQVNPDVRLLGYSSNYVNVDSYVKRETIFNMAEDAGSDISYRCIKCRSCSDCKDHDISQTSSIREEVEQHIINESVHVDIENNITTATLPFIKDPKIRLEPNRHKAMKVYQQQLKRLNKYEQDKQDVIKSERKLQDLGHVDFVRNLPIKSQQALESNKTKNYIPWRAVWKPNSISTPCRIVFDASQPTGSGHSLNSILAKGSNGMNRLVDIFIRWFTHKVAFHTDIAKMYNSIKLAETDWCYQRYLWNDSLDEGSPPEEKIIKTLIYGVKSSGNQSERGLRQTAHLMKQQYPEVSRIVERDVYVDDCATGEDTTKLAMQRADEMEIVCSKGGFGLKGFTFSGKDPIDKLSADGRSIHVGGIRWFSKDDVISIDFAELNFAKKVRGKKPTTEREIPSNLTRRQCVSKAAEIFDITGKLTPFTAAMKLDLHDLVERKLGWDDAIPDSLRPIWQSHFEMMEEIKDVTFNRCIIPEDAVDVKISTLNFGDASKSIAASAIYGRVLRKNGLYSCQLIFARSKIIQNPSSQPRGELSAAVLNTHTGEVVKQALQSKHDGWTKLTDSQIVLHWIHNDEIKLKPFVHNRVVEIQRFTNPNDWFYVQTDQMLADIATRRGASLQDVNSQSRWINGDDWMKQKDLPIKSVRDIILNLTEINEIKKETSTVASAICNFASRQRSGLPDEVKERYTFSSYLLDPNKFLFKKCVRILAIVYKYYYALKSLAKVKGPKKFPNISMDEKPMVILSNQEIQRAEHYYWWKGSAEVRHFVKAEKYKRFTKDINGVLTYTGRILDSDNVQITTPMTSAMKDLQSTTFCVPVLDKHSPISYAIVNEAHWDNKVVKHSGVESTWRYVLKRAFIIEGRDIVKMVRRSCQLCRHIQKKKVQVEMGKMSNASLTIAPAFYNSQVDLAGPFLSYDSYNKRKTIKIWLVVFVCSTTSTTSIKTMDDYSSPAFFQAFTRFACDAGYPKSVFVDRGSQILKTYNNAKINFNDMKYKLHYNVDVEFELCPVDGHNYNGKVERRIREIKQSLTKSYNDQKLSVLQWETVASEIANCINDLPISLGNYVSDFESMDLITPNRLKLGRNNERSPVGPYELSNDPSKIVKANSLIYQSWFDSWLINHVPKLVNQPKWFKSDTDIRIGDVVLFLKNSPLKFTYQYGMVEETIVSKDNKIRQVKVCYRNHSENCNRTTVRHVRELIVIHYVNEKSIIEQLNNIADQC